MKAAIWTSIICTLLAAPLARPVEIATGSMLGPRYKAARFYVRSSPRGDWRETYESGEYKKQARGKLMMVRVAQGLFDDEWLEETPFDADANTDALIASLDVYKAHGVMALAVSLQGADPGYSGGSSGIQRGPAANDGNTDGSLISAFRPDGSVKPEWLARLGRLLDAADQRGMIVCLGYFAPMQDEVLESPEAIVEAARNVTKWLIENDHRNVILDLAQGWDLEGDTWDHGRFLPLNVGRLVMEVRDLFNGAAFVPPIGASAAASLAYPDSLARLCDVIMLTGAGHDPAAKARGLGQFQKPDRPVWIVNDLSVGGLEPAAGWSFTPLEQAERFPFAYQPAEADLFREQLNRIAELVMKKPPALAKAK